MAAILEYGHHLAVLHEDGFLAGVDGQYGVGVEILFRLLPNEHVGWRGVLQRLKNVLLAALIG